MKQPSLQEQYRSAIAIGDALEVLTLDGLWTGHLARNAVVSEPDLHTLRQITDRMISLLPKCAEDSKWAADLLAKLQIESAPKIEGKAADIFNDVIVRRVNENATANRVILIERVNNAPMALSDLVPIETATINTKLEELSKGNNIGGDLSHDGQCAIQGYMAGLSVGVAFMHPAEGLFAAYQVAELVQHCG
jgi:hypothetical protein